MPIDWDTLLTDIAFGVILGVVIIIGAWVYRFGWPDLMRAQRRKRRDRNRFRDTGFTYSDTGPTWGGDGGSDGGGGD